MKKSNSGSLYIVPTPIGNLSDMTFRAVEVLKEVDLIGAEDTRTSSKLLKHYDIKTPLQSYHKFNERARAMEFIDRLSKGENIAIISDAGTPGISDPASVIIKEAINNKITVVTLPGATALVPAFVSSGMSSSRFYFIGFLPDKKKDCDKLLEEVLTIKSPLIFYESPHRIIQTLEKFNSHFGDRKVCIGREISKKFETYYYGNLSHFTAEDSAINAKGEFVIVLDGFEEEEITDDLLIERLRQHVDTGIRKKEAVKRVMKELGVSKNRVYELSLNL